MLLGPRVVILPHLGASTKEAEDNCAIMVADQVRDYLEDGNVRNSVNFPDWRTRVAGRMKFRQILNAFSDSIGPETNKYVCAPCSNCKGQLRDIFSYYDIWEKHSILYDGLVELIVNAMPQVQPGFIDWEWH